MQQLTSVEEAKALILDHIENFGIEEVSFTQSQNRVLAEAIYADRDFPPFDRVSMDGIGLSFEVFESGQREFKVEGIQPAGSPQLILKDKANCIEVMTGAILPEGCDVVIPYEEVEIEGGIARVQIEETSFFKNIHKQGKDQQKGDLIIFENTLISPAEIGVITTVGKTTVKVRKFPKVMIVSTGDELVDVHETPADYQIRRSNVYTLVGLLERLHIPADVAHIDDDKSVLKETIAGFFDTYDVLLFSGAVSKGKFDYLPEVLDELGVEKKFHRVGQRPGKPFWFGKKAEKTVFAFPGNPISTYVNCVKYFYPWVRKCLDLPRENVEVVLGEDVNFKPNLTYFLQVKIKFDQGRMIAYPVQGNGSGDLANLVKADGFVEFIAGKDLYKAGEVVQFIGYR